MKDNKIPFYKQELQQQIFKRLRKFLRMIKVAIE